MEADRRVLTLEVERWRRRCFGLERANATLDPLLNEAQMRLEASCAHERRVGMNLINEKLGKAEQEKEIIRVLNDFTEAKFRIQKLESALADKDTDIDALREQLRAEAAKTLGMAGRAQLACRGAEDASAPALARERECRGRAEDKVVQHEARIQQYQESLHAATAREVALTEEVKVGRSIRQSLEDANRRLRLDLQEVLSQAVRGGERPYYMGCNAAEGVYDPKAPPLDDASPPRRPASGRSTARRSWGTAAAGGEDSAAAGRPPLSPKTPRRACTAGKRAVLDDRERVLNRVDDLLREIARG